jgi:hypothetical protein
MLPPVGGHRRQKQSAQTKKHSPHKNTESLSAENIDRLCHALPEPLCERRRELLPRVLREWWRVELQRHLSMKSRAAIRQQIQKLERASKLARDLSNALNALDDSDRAVALHEMLRREGCLETISHSEYLDRRQ